MGRIRRSLVLAAYVACAKAGGGDSPDSSKPIDGKPADGNGCPVQPCTILPQCGCLGLSACDVDDATLMGTSCRTITTPGHETAACDSPDDCDKAFVCLGGSAYASCKKYCTADADCGTPRGKCVIDVTSGGLPIPNIPTVCSSNCDPASTTVPECPLTFKCGMFSTTHNGTDVQIADCTPAGGGIQGGNCKATGSGDDKLCARGYSCTTTNGGTTYVCRRVCTDPGNPTSSQCGGQACIVFSNGFTLAGVSYGVCAP